ncbi:hypothetical protein DL93DRAFT_1828030 [Clavulina sp. PMI_390]|nr:hypothetical protein DL93DRAFT_1828030 [Clavulina sp. PMI_390]
MPKVQRNHQNQPAQNHDANLVTKTPKAAHSWRAERACDTCRKKKARCETAELSSGSSSRSCLNCVAAGTECTFTDEYSRRATSKFYVDHLEQKVKDMEALLRTLALRVDMSADLEQHGLRSLLGSTKNSHDPMLSCSKNADGPAS